MGVVFIWKMAWLKWGFHGMTNRANDRHKTADLLDIDKIFTLCQQFVESAD